MGKLDSDDGAQSASHVVFPFPSLLPFLQAAARISCLKLGGGSWEVSAATALCSCDWPNTLSLPSRSLQAGDPAQIASLGLDGGPTCKLQFETQGFRLLAISHTPPFFLSVSGAAAVSLVVTGPVCAECPRDSFPREKGGAGDGGAARR